MRRVFASGSVRERKTMRARRILIVEDEIVALGGGLCDSALLSMGERELSVLAENVFEYSPVAHCITSGDRLLYANPAFEALTGYSTSELGLSDIFHLSSQPPGVIHSVGDADLSSWLETRIMTKSGQERWVIASSRALDCAQGAAALWTIMDVSKYKQEMQSLKQSELRYRAAFEFAPDMVFLYGLDGTILDANPVALKAMGVPREGAIGHNGPDEFWAKEDRDRFPKILEETVRRGEFFDEIKGEHSNGRSWYAESNARVAKLEHETFVVVIVRDTTERRALEDQLRSALREKETLLREIHHRVKNNMQIISTLLKLQLRNTDDETTKALFRESQNRILSMAMIHEKLYQSEGLHKIDLKEYIDDLSREVFTSYGLDAERIALRANVEDIALGMDTAVPCGLILIELLSNSLKYAFPEGRRGEIVIGLQAEGADHFTLTVADDGVGLPKTIEIASLSSLGLRLVSDLATYQLEGALRFGAGPGTRVDVTFRERKR